MKICIICNEYPEGPHGGIGTVTQLLAEEFTRMEHTVKIIGVYDHSYSSPDFEIRNGVEIIRVKVDYSSKVETMIGFWRISRKIKKWIDKNAVDLIECPDSYGIFSLFANFRRPMILRSHGNNTYFCSILGLPIRKMTFFYEKNLYRKAYRYLAVSHYTAKHTQKLFNLTKPFEVVYNGIALPEPSDYSKSESLIGEKFDFPTPIIFSGTLIKKKGIYEAIKAVLILLSEGEKITLLVNGKDTINPITGQSVLGELKEMIPESHVANFRFNGHITRQELQFQYTRSKAALFPSYAEAFAMAPMESMVCGLPTIFSNTCSGRELITDKVDGMLVEPTSPESIAEAIRYVIKNPDKAEEMGKKGQNKIRTHFSKEMMAQKSIEFYEQVYSSYYAERSS